MGERGFSRKAVFVKKRAPKIRVPKPQKEPRYQSNSQRTMTKNILR